MVKPRSVDPVTGVRFSLGAQEFVIIRFMEKNASNVLLLTVLIIGLGLGYIFGGSQVATQNQNTHVMPDGTVMSNSHAFSAMDDAMHDMTTALEGKSGSDFDKEFLKQMIVHHQGAVEMAEMVLVQSDEPQLKSFAEDIIEVQSKEINMMQTWLSAGFSVSNTDTDNNVACTMDAKICPDGSAVGRQGPNCEFAKCPGI